MRVAGAVHMHTPELGDKHKGNAPSWVVESMKIASELMGSLPESSTAHFKSALNRWDNFTEVRKLRENNVKAHDVVCYCMTRIAQAETLPAQLRGPRGPIATGTLRKEISYIRRGRLARGEDTAPFDHASVIELLKKVATKTTNVTSDKNPVLYADVVASEPGPKATFEQIRNHAILALGFFFGLRSGEYAQLLIKHLTFPAGSAVGLELRIDKTNYNVLSTQAPRNLRSGGKVLFRWLHRYLDAFPKAMPKGPRAALFPALQNTKQFAKPLVQRTIANIVGKLVPGCTGHSMRVGFCTEAVAAEVSPDDVGEFGRWLGDDMRRLYTHRTTDAGVKMAKALMRGNVRRNEDGTLTRATGSTRTHSVMDPTTAQAGAKRRKTTR